MKLNNLKDRLTNKKELVPTVLLAVSVLCGILILIKVTSFFVASARAESVVKGAIEQNGTAQKNVEKYLADSAAITGELKKNNLFAPPAPKQNPVKEVTGIFGDQVYINNKWYNVGDTIADAKIVAIGPTSVTIAWDGKEKTFLPIQANVAEGKGGQRGGAPGAGNGKEGDNKNANGAGPTQVTVQVEAPPNFGGRGGPGGQGFMAMRQRFQNMSEEERQAFRDQMRQRFGGGRGGQGGGRRGGQGGGRGGPGGRGPGGN
jgi:hypothetical protein